MLDQFYTWESLGTFTGATAAVLLIVQYLKLPLDKIAHIPTRIVVLEISIAIQGAVAAMSGAGWDWHNVPLIILNAFLVALAAMGAYESTFARVEG